MNHKPRLILLAFFLLTCSVGFGQTKMKTKSVDLTSPKKQTGSESNNGSKPTHNSDHVFSVVEDMPIFKGGMEAFLQFIAENTQYPPQAPSGVVYVSYVVYEDGSVNDVRLLRGTHPALDAEALRVVRKLPNYLRGGLQRGQPVKVQFNLPVRFKR